MTHNLFVRAVARHLLLPTWMVALALLARGHDGTGDGFSAALLVVLGVLLQYLAFGYRQIEGPGGALIPLRWLPRLVGIGLLALVSAVLAPMLAGAPPLTHYPRPAQAVPHLGSFALHTGFLVDVGVFLVVLGFGLTIMSRASRYADAVQLAPPADKRPAASAAGRETRSRP